MLLGPEFCWCIICRVIIGLIMLACKWEFTCNVSMKLSILYFKILWSLMPVRHPWGSLLMSVCFSIWKHVSQSATYAYIEHKLSTNNLRARISFFVGVNRISTLFFADHRREALSFESPLQHQWYEEVYVYQISHFYVKQFLLYWYWHVSVVVHPG